jgi:hypothetical protein
MLTGCGGGDEVDPVGAGDGRQESGSVDQAARDQGEQTTEKKTAEKQLADAPVGSAPEETLGPPAEVASDLDLGTSADDLMLDEGDVESSVDDRDLPPVAGDAPPAAAGAPAATPARPAPRVLGIREFNEQYKDESPKRQWKAKVLSDNRRVPHGSFVEFYPGGQKFTEGEYTDGRRHGRWLFHHPSGKVGKEGEYKESTKTVSPMASGSYTGLTVRSCGRRIIEMANTTAAGPYTPRTASRLGDKWNLRMVPGTVSGSRGTTRGRSNRRRSSRTAA